MKNTLHDIAQLITNNGTNKHSGDQAYTCVWFKRRSPNILEFQYGAEWSVSFSEHLCDDKYFTSADAWITQGSK